MYLDFKEERDRDFMDAYKSILKQYGENAPFIKKEILIQETVAHPAKRFYVSPEQALRIISRLLKNQKVNFKNEVKKKMYLALLQKVRERLPSEHPLIYIITEAIYTEAPCFYLTPGSASILYYQLIKKTIQ